MHIGETPEDTVNNPKMMKRRTSEVNMRSLLAVHATSMSWQDFLLFCSTMDLPVPGHNISKLSLEKLIAATNVVSDRSKAHSPAQVRDSIGAQQSTSIGPSSVM